MPRSITYVIGSTLFLAVAAQAQTTPAKPVAVRSAIGAAAAAVAPVRIDRHAAITLLAKRIENVKWIDLPLEEVMDWLEAQADGRVNIIPRWSQLAQQGLTRDTLVNLKLFDTNVSEILNEIIDDLQAIGPMAYHAIGNKLRVSAQSDFDRKLRVRVYGAADLLHRVPDMGGAAPSIDLQASGGGGGGSGGGSSTSVFSSSGGVGGADEVSGQQAEQAAQARLGTLAFTIAGAVQPTSWGTVLGTPVGTGPGTILVHDRSLIVYATIEVHEKIGGLFRLGR